MSLVASCRLSGTTLFFLERCTLNFSDAEVVLDPDGLLPAFRTEEDARTEIARRFPLPRAVALTEQSSEDELAAAMEDQYGQRIKLFYDIDAVREWTNAPGPHGITPGQAVEVWELCWQVGDAPVVQHFDPMGLFAIQENILREPERREAYETLLLGMKLSGIVIAAREKRAPADWNMEWPEMQALWPQTDYTRLAAILQTGIAGFTRRIYMANRAS